MLIEKILCHINDITLEQRSLTKDLVLLDHYDMEKPHQKIYSAGGVELSVSLPKGQQLHVGAVLFMDETKMIVVDLKEEDVLEVFPKGEEQWGIAGFNIGNMHQSCYFTEDSILLSYDPLVERLIQSMEIPFKRELRKLEGKRPNVSTHSHQHSHAHKDGHTLSHTHENDDHTHQHPHVNEEGNHHHSHTYNDCHSQGHTHGHHHHEKE